MAAETFSPQVKEGERVCQREDALFLSARLRLCFRDDVDDFAGHGVDQKNLVFHFRIAVVGKLRDLLRQIRWKSTGLDAFRQFGADSRIEIFGRFRGFELELNLGVLGEQCLTNLLALRGAQMQLGQRGVLRHGIAAALFNRAARVVGGQCDA